MSGVVISDSENLMACYQGGSKSPADLFVRDFASRKFVKLTKSLSPEINADDLVDSRVIVYKSFDGMEIPAILYQPHDATAEAKVPAIVRVHGGPGAGRRGCHTAPRCSFLVNHGYAVLDVKNNRGSSGYGKTFYKADDQKHGKEPLWDCVEAKEIFCKRSITSMGRKLELWADRMAEYMVLAALAFKPEEEFNAGVDIFGVSNWVRTLQSIPPYWESQRKSLYAEIGDPNTQLDMLREISPLFHADKITKPLLVLQGANDPRVIKPESDEIVDAIKKKKGVVEYVVFDNEGHGFTKKANEISRQQGDPRFSRQAPGRGSARRGCRYELAFSVLLERAAQALSNVRRWLRGTVVGGFEGNSRFEAFGAKTMIPILRFGFVGQNVKLVTRIVQAVHKPARRARGVRAAADLHQAFIDPHRHALIENETFALPVLVPELFLVSRDSAMKLKDAVETFLFKKGGRLFAPDAPGAIHQDCFVLQVLQEIDEIRQLPEMLDVARDGVLEFAGG